MNNRDSMDDMVRQYVDRVLRLRAEREEDLLDASDLEDIAREVGLTDDDLAAVHDEVREHRTRASGYLRHGMASDAVAELDQAAALAPWDIELQMELASALTTAWAEGDRKVHDRAERLTLKVLDADPGRDDAFDLLQKLREPPAPASDFAPEPRVGSLPVAFTEPTHDLEFLTWESSHEVYDDAAYCAFMGWIRNGGTAELARLTCSIVMRGSGKELVEEKAYLISSGPALRPGDTRRFTATIGGPRWDVETIDLHITTLDSKPGASSYPASPLVDFAWGAQCPAGVELEIRERSRTWSDSSTHQRMQLEVRNLGTRALEDLYLDVHYYDDESRELVTGDVWVQSGGFPPFLPGELRVESDWVDLDVAPARYDLVVREVG